MSLGPAQSEVPVDET